MLVGGCFGLLKVLSLLWRQVRLRRYRDTGDVDADVEDVYNDDDDDDDEGGGAIMSKSSRYTRHTCIYCVCRFTVNGYISTIAYVVWTDDTVFVY